MGQRIIPFRMKKLNKKLTLLLEKSLEELPPTPIERLEREAVEFEKLMLQRRE